MLCWSICLQSEVDGLTLLVLEIFAAATQSVSSVNKAAYSIRYHTRTVVIDVVDRLIMKVAVIHWP